MEKDIINKIKILKSILLWKAASLFVQTCSLTHSLSHSLSLSVCLCVSLSLLLSLQNKPCKKKLTPNVLAKPFHKLIPAHSFNLFHCTQAQPVHICNLRTYHCITAYCNMDIKFFDLVTGLAWMAKSLNRQTEILSCGTDMPSRDRSTHGQLLS